MSTFSYIYIYIYTRWGIIPFALGKKIIENVRFINNLCFPGNLRNSNVYCFKNWSFYLFTFQLSPFMVSPLQVPYSKFSPASMRVLTHPPTHSHFNTKFWGFKPSQDQGPPLSLMPDEAILCYICGWSHGAPPYVLFGW